MSGSVEDDTNVLLSAAASASYRMLLNLMFRVLSFVMNGVLLHYVTSHMLGVVNVRLILLHSTILLVAREGFRRACVSKSSKQNWGQVINLVWCIVPIGILTAMVFSYVWLYLLEVPDPIQMPNYHIGVYSYASCAVIEILSEPVWLTAHAFLFVKLKAVIESVCIITRSIINILLVVYFTMCLYITFQAVIESVCIITRSMINILLVMYFPDWGIIAFSVAQVVFTVLWVTAYYAYFSWYVSTQQKKDDSFPVKSVREFLPTKAPGKPWISTHLVVLTWSFVKQSFLKQLLTEGEYYVMTVFGVLSFAEQGVYDVINNLGSLAARFIFQAVEESGYLFFSQTLTREVPIKEQNKDTILLASRVLESLLKLVTYIGLIVLIFGYSYSYLFLDLYGGNTLSQGPGPVLLRVYCLYVLIIAINGTTECFVFAAMSKLDVDRYNYKMMLFSLLFLLASWSLTQWLGSVGFILANCLNMLARIIHSVYFINLYYKGSEFHPLRGILPSAPVMISLTASLLITALSEQLLCCDKGNLYRLVHFGIGVVCGLSVLGSIYLSEKQLLIFIKEQYQKMKKIKTKTN
ncbi:protein RFT1 homolog [Lingula anatina]|uniref:Protein RFT1 homolog n=1 Tax=Lingula anatina TaxID=7574 RepID=A0A1S3HMC7_LINAN|nr:protein RFT1 homolog [Lingula anatina]|eukprot:XP_013387167.1 protein RFT1 homolog [Lingula anatina]